MKIILLKLKKLYLFITEKLGYMTIYSDLKILNEEIVRFYDEFESYFTALEADPKNANFLSSTKVKIQNNNNLKLSFLGKDFLLIPTINATKGTAIIKVLYLYYDFLTPPPLELKIKELPEMEIELNVNYERKFKVVRRSTSYFLDKVLQNEHSDLRTNGILFFFNELLKEVEKIDSEQV